MQAYILILSFCLIQFNVSLESTDYSFKFSSFQKGGCFDGGRFYNFTISGKAEGLENNEAIGILLEEPGYISAICQLTKSQATNAGEEDVFKCQIDTKRYALVKANTELKFRNSPDSISTDRVPRPTFTGWEEMTKNPILDSVQCYYPYNYQLNLFLDKGIERKFISGSKQELKFTGAYETKTNSLKKTDKYKISPFLVVDSVLKQAECTITPEETTESNSSETPCSVSCTLEGSKTAQFFDTIISWDTEQNSGEYVFIPKTQAIALSKSSFLKLSAFLLLSLLL